MNHLLNRTSRWVRFYHCKRNHLIKFYFWWQNTLRNVSFLSQKSPCIWWRQELICIVELHMIDLSFFLNLIKSYWRQLIHRRSEFVTSKFWKIFRYIFTFFFISLCSSRHEIVRQFRSIDLNFLSWFWDSSHIYIRRFALRRIRLLLIHAWLCWNSNFVLNC